MGSGFYILFMIRQHIVFRGDVQGVGFRYRARYAAGLYGCTGWARNEWDGTVTMEIQGSQSDINAVIRDIDNGHFVHITSMDARNIPLIEDERGFGTR